MESNRFPFAEMGAIDGDSVKFLEEKYDSERLKEIFENGDIDVDYDYEEYFNEEILGDGEA